MQLSASRLAQWLVQGDYYSITLDGNNLVLDSQKTSDVISFDDWDGSIAIHRGVLWGALELTSSDQQYCWTIHGLPWHECKPFAAFLIRTYQDWAQHRVDKLDAQLPEMLQRINIFSNKSGYLRDSEYKDLHQFLNDGLKSSDLTVELATSFRPQSFEKITPWLHDHQAWVDEHNQRWLEQQSQKWSSWFDSFESSPLNESQRTAILTNQDANLVLAGPGTGKTNILVARAGYLIASQLAKPEEILMLSFDRHASEKMTVKLKEHVSKDIKVATFHRLGSQIIRNVEKDKPNVASITLDTRARCAWIARMLIEQWNNVAAAQKWQRHLTQWRIPGFSKENTMEQQAENEQLQAWIWRHIELLSQSGLKKESLIDSINISKNNVMRPRMKSELELLWPCYQAYLQHLKVKKQVDFNSMIEVATDYVKAGKFISPWRYIMVDEYQDISPQRLALIEALCHQKGADQLLPTLFAVGDDCQAIYRFSREDISLIDDFKQRFGTSCITELTTSYRFNNKIGDVANSFIEKNPSQISKKVNYFAKQSKNAVTLLAIDLLPQELIRLSKLYASKKTKVLILGRNTNQQPSHFNEWKDNWPQLDLEYMTCHSSKGYEADYVFIVGVNKGIFPSVERETGLAAIMQSQVETYPDAEERRLFYVALTRAKKHVWVCADPVQSSPFIDELIEDQESVNNKIKRTK